MSIAFQKLGFLNSLKNSDDKNITLIINHPRGGKPNKIIINKSDSLLINAISEVLNNKTIFKISYALIDGNLKIAILIG